MEVLSVFNVFNIYFLFVNLFIYFLLCSFSWIGIYYIEKDGFDFIEIYCFLSVGFYLIFILERSYIRVI